MKARLGYAIALLAVFIIVLSACTAPAGSTTAAAPTSAAGGDAAADAAATEPPTEETEFSDDAYTTPHPILSDLRVRQALAQCIDRDALIASVYPYVDDETKPTLRMDSFLPKSHWAYSGPYQDYPYDPEAGAALLEEAGWTLADGAAVRTNAQGDPLELTLTTTDAQFRQTWAAVAEQNLEGCGFTIERNHAPASWWFGDTTGLARREFELGAYAWVGQTNPSGQTLYACNQIPLPTNNWEGQNYMGWCNQTASDAIVMANNTINQDERIAPYDIFQEEFAKDMVSLPLFQRIEAEGWSTNMEGIQLSPTEYGTASAADWALTDGGDTIVMGLTQEPASMFTLVESAAVQAQIAQMAVQQGNTQYDYDYQPVQQQEFSTIESGLATNETVTVEPGDIVYNIDGEPEELAAGTRIFANGEIIEYDGSSSLELPQLTVTYALNPYTWSDGTPGSIEDVKLAYSINCDPDSGATSFTTCDTFGDIAYNEAGDSIEWTITYLPGVQDPYYYVMPFSISPRATIYPAHQVVSDGRQLADVPAAEWQTLPEIAETPLSAGPFMITEWIKGQRLTLEANPYYEGETGVDRIVVVFIPDTNQAVAQLLSGDVDYLERATLGAGPEVQTVLDAAEAGQVNAELLPSPTWEHIDMNLFIP